MEGIGVNGRDEVPESSSVVPKWAHWRIGIWMRSGMPGAGNADLQCGLAIALHTSFDLGDILVPRQLMWS